MKVIQIVRVRFAAIALIKLEKQESKMSFLTKYRSPANEASVVKNVPMAHLISARQEVRDAFPGRRVVVRFRGPRCDTMALYCRKQDAVSFAVYVD
jgi:hypothetical protein